MAGDSVSPQEWKRRRKRLDEDTVRDKQRLLKAEGGDASQKALDAYKYDLNYKKNYGKELGYGSRSAKKSAGKKAQSKKMGKR